MSTAEAPDPVVEQRASALQVLDRAFGILTLFNSESSNWSLSEVAREMGLKTTTVHRILQVLRQHGYLGRDETTKRYHLGMAAMDLGLRAQHVLHRQAGAAKSLRWLASATRETSFLLVPSEDQLFSVCVQRAEGSQPLRLSVEVGRRIPIHAGAAQKVLLAFMSPADQAAVLARPLMKVARKTVVVPAQLRADLAMIAKQGWAMSFEETHEETWGVSVALLYPTGSIGAAVGVAGPLFRHTNERATLFLRECQRAARSISEEIGLREFKPRSTRKAW